jgi:hypothetical protein
MRVQSEQSRAVATLVGTDVPESIRDLSTLEALDYIDLFTIRTPRAGAHSAEEWARAVLERAPLSRQGSRVLWTFIGLRLGATGSPDHVQGWRIADRSENLVRLETSSWYLRAQALCVVERDDVSLSLSLEYSRPEVARIVWKFVAGPHQRAVPVMLRQAAQLMDEQA